VAPEGEAAKVLSLKLEQDVPELSAISMLLTLKVPSAKPVGNVTVMVCPAETPDEVMNWIV
jgi:hypothetical protein